MHNVETRKGGARLAARMSLKLVILLSLAAFLFVASISLGSVPIPMAEVAKILLGEDASDPIWRSIVLDSRLPRALAAVLAGAALSISGLTMQTLFRNPLAGPYVMGVDAGASLGVALATLLAGVGTETFLGAAGWFGHVGRLSAATIGAAVTLLIVFALSIRLRSDVTLLVVGLLIGYFTSGVVGILIYLSVPEAVQLYLQWTFGSFAGVTWSSLGSFSIAVGVGIAITAFLVKPLDAMLAGEEFAQSVGINVRRARLLMIASASLLAASVTAVCGPIGFIGVAVPHLARATLGSSRHRILLPGTLIWGIVIALASDLVARMPGSHTALPLNAVTALFGAPLLVWLVWRRLEIAG